MIRDSFLKDAIQDKAGFRWRNDDVSRIEGFTDAVLGFAITLLVVSLEIPNTFDELLHAMKGFIAFAITFTFLIYIWYSHYIFFKRYGLKDVYTIVLNAILLFVVLFYIYPLKFLFNMLVYSLIGEPLTHTLSDGTLVNIISKADSALLMIIYAIGYIAVFLVFALMYLHAYRLKNVLKLNELERLHTLHAIKSHSIMVLFGLFSIILALFGFIGWAGIIYSFVGFAQMFLGISTGRKIRRLNIGNAKV